MGSQENNPATIHQELYKILNSINIIREETDKQFGKTEIKLNKLIDETKKETRLILAYINQINDKVQKIEEAELKNKIGILNGDILSANNRILEDLRNEENNNDKKRVYKKLKRIIKEEVNNIEAYVKGIREALLNKNYK